MSGMQLPLIPVTVHEWDGRGEIVEHLHGLEGHCWAYLCPECAGSAELAYTRSEVSGRMFLQCAECGCRVRWGQIIHFDETLKRWAENEHTQKGH